MKRKREREYFVYMLFVMTVMSHGKNENIKLVIEIEKTSFESKQSRLGLNFMVSKIYHRTLDSTKT